MKMTSFKHSLGTMIFLSMVFFWNGTGLAASPENLALKMEADQLLKRGGVEKAIPLYQEVIRQDRDFANAYYNLATAYYLQGELPKAIENLEAFLRLHPHDAEALYNLGSLRLRLGEFMQAKECFLRATKFPCAPELRQKIKSSLEFSILLGASAQNALPV